MDAKEDPWDLSMRLLAMRPARWSVGVERFAVRWDPVTAINPLRGDARNFSYLEAAEFVRSCLAIRPGTPRSRHVRRRMERLNQAPEFTALVLEIGGPHGHPVLYVKWVVDRSGDEPMIMFLSFHSLRRIGP